MINKINKYINYCYTKACVNAEELMKLFCFSSYLLLLLTVCSNMWKWDKDKISDLSASQWSSVK